MLRWTITKTDAHSLQFRHVRWQHDFDGKGDHNVQQSLYCYRW